MLNFIHFDHWHHELLLINLTNQIILILDNTSLSNWFQRVSSEDAFKKAIDKIIGGKDLSVCQVCPILHSNNSRYILINCLNFKLNLKKYSLFFFRISLSLIFHLDQ